MMIQKKDLLDPDEIFADSANVTNLSYGSEGKLEKPIAGLYYILFLLLMGAGLAYLVSRSIVLQIKEGDNFLAKSQENRFLTRPIFPPRGVIYDRSGNVLVENHPSFGLLLDMREFFSGGGKIEDLVKILNDGLGYESGAFSNNSRDFPRQVVLAQGIAPSAMVSLAPRLFQVDGVHFFESFRRIYKDNFAYSHVLGFVGSMSEEELARSSDLKSGDSIGKSGLEAYYDEILRGEAGKKIVEIDAHGEEMRFRTVDEPKRGSDISLTLDGDLQGFIYKTIENYTAGVKGASVVALDPRGGEVRALVSFPGFNSNKFGHSLSSKEFEAVLGNRLKPLFNRAISGEFPSGSTIKPLIGAAALEEKIIDPQKLIYDEGYIEIPNPYLPGERSVFVDWKKHGWINFYDAIAQSANVYFYIVGGGYKDQKGLGIGLIKKYAEAFGLGSLLGIDLPGERPGLVPNPEWKKIAEPSNPIWRVGDTYNVSIGQGGVKVTPLQMAALVSAIANGGRLYKPYLLDSVIDVYSGAIQKNNPQLIREGMVGEDVLEEVRKGMRKTVTGGTAGRLAGLPVASAAKTGTAQAGSGIPHAWVTVFAPYENPEIAVTVMVEHAGEGSTVAVPITYEILKYYFENQK